MTTPQQPPDPNADAVAKRAITDFLKERYSVAIDDMTAAKHTPDFTARSRASDQAGVDLSVWENGQLLRAGLAGEVVNGLDQAAADPFADADTMVKASAVRALLQRQGHTLPPDPNEAE